MSHVRFDPSKAVSFDLSHGLVHLDGASSQLLLPAEAVRGLLAAAGGEATRTFGRALGDGVGRRVARRLAVVGGLREASVDAVIEHLGGELSIAGFGSLSLERWGQALVLVVDQSPLAAAGDSLLADVLESALAAASTSRVRAIFLGRDAARARFLIAGNAGAEKIRAWLAEGISWGEALVRLHGRGGMGSTKAREEASSPLGRTSATREAGAARAPIAADPSAAALPGVGGAVAQAAKGDGPHAPSAAAATEPAAPPRGDA